MHDWRAHSPPPPASHTVTTDKRIDQPRGRLESAHKRKTRALILSEQPCRLPPQSNHHDDNKAARITAEPEGGLAQSSSRSQTNSYLHTAPELAQLSKPTHRRARVSNRRRRCHHSMLQVDAGVDPSSHHVRTVELLGHEIEPRRAPPSSPTDIDSRHTDVREADRVSPITGSPSRRPVTGQRR